MPENIELQSADIKNIKIIKSLLISIILILSLPFPLFFLSLLLDILLDFGAILYFFYILPTYPIYQWFLPLLLSIVLLFVSFRREKPVLIFMAFLVFFSVIFVSILYVMCSFYFFDHIAWP